MLSILLFIAQIWFFVLLAVGLHRLSPRLGLTPFLFFVAGLVAILNAIELNFLLIRPFAGVDLRPGGHVYVPIILLVILILYVANGTRPAQLLLYGIIGINLLVLIAFIFLWLYLNLYSPNTQFLGGLAENNPFDAVFMRGILASLLAFTANMFVIIIAYQGISNAFPRLPHWIAPGIALILALWTDSVVYNLGAFLGTERFILQVPSDILMKSLAGILLWPVASAYLSHIAPRMPEFVGAKNRPTFDILFMNGRSNANLETLETELRISRSVYRQLTQNIEEIFWLVDIEKRSFLYISPAFERITGYDVERFYRNANALLEIVHPDERLIREGSVMRFLMRVRETEFRIIRPDKSERWLRTRSFAVKDDGGEVIRYAGIAEDITDKKKASERSFHLALAQERMRILHDFIRDASHDLKNPISAMLLKIDLLEKVENPERQQEIRLELKDRAKSLSDLIDDLFTLSRIEGHEITPLESLSFNELVKKVLKQMQPLAENKGLALGLDLAPSACTLFGNPEQLERLINNLLVNAIRYTAEGRIELKTWETESQVYFQIRDTGMGIPAEAIPKIFDRFFRSENVRKAKIAGTGLGLAITKAILERHKGEISVESEMAKGTIFTVSIPKTSNADKQSEENRLTQEIHPIVAD